MTNLEKLSWLIGKLKTFDRLTLRELSSEWQDRTGSRLDRSTFNRWRAEIASRFNLNITCSRQGGEYYYRLDNPENIEKSGIDNWILNSVSLGHTLNEYKSLAHRIITDTEAYGTEYLGPVLQAMRSGVGMDLTYQGFGKTEWTFRAEPYALRQHQGRWYVLCKTAKFEFLTLYAFDRIKGIHLRENDRFSLPDKFDAGEYFAGYFGVMTNTGKDAGRIVVRAYWKHACYLRSKPLHPSQQEIGSGEDHADFAYYVAPTFDFTNALLGMGPLVEVIYPEDYRNLLAETLREMLALYNRTDR